MADDGALELVTLRNTFYRDNYRKVVMALLISLSLVAALTVSLIVVISNRPSPVYYATTSDGRLFPMTALDQPVMTTPELLNWVTTAVTSSLSMNFLEYRQQVQASEQYFTSNGYTQFRKALDESGNLKKLQDSKLIVSTVPAAPPVILGSDKGTVIDGRLSWWVQIPLVRMSVGANGSNTVSDVVTLLVQRRKTLDSPYGVGIAKIDVGRG